MLEISDLEQSLDIEETCSSYESCASCTTHSGCVYCPEEDLCVEGTIEGPSDYTCASFDFGQCSGVYCQSYDDCSSCINNAKCGWCDSSNECFNYDAEEVDCDSDDVYNVYATNNYCPSDDSGNYIVLYSTEDDETDKLQELEARAIDLNFDIARLEEDLSELDSLAEDYPSFLEIDNN